MHRSTPAGLAVTGSALLLLGVFTACSTTGARPITATDGTGGAAGTGGARAGGMDGDAGTPADPPDAAPPDAVPPSPDAGSPSAEFKMIYEATLRPTCGGPGRFCHANELLSTKLDFNTLEKAFNNLVNVPTALSCATSAWPPIRVVPYDPAASAVMYVREDGCNRHGTFVTFRDADLAAIEAWIAAGAK